jgi:hypothetical protein
MIHVTEGSSRLDFLSKLGFDLLTGEACGLGARILCDVTASGRQLLTVVLGLTGLVPANAWNHRPGTIGSVMIPHEMFTPLIIFGMLRDPQVQAVYLTEDGVYGMTSDEEIRQLDEADWIKVTRRFHRRGTAPGGLRHVHVMSGRIV